MKRSRYIVTEAAIGAAFSAAISLAFVAAIFGGTARIPLLTTHGVVVDGVPQSFMIVLMASLVPRLLLRRRTARGHAPGPPPAMTVSRLAVASVLVALAATVLLVAAQAALLLLLTPSFWPFTAVLIYKLIYGGALGGATAALVVARDLRAVDGQPA